MNITIGSSGKEISWDNKGQVVKKSYTDTLMGYEILPDDSGIILLEPASVVGSENAVIYNKDGSKRWRLPFPSGLGKGFVFDRVGISQGKLVVIGIVSGRDVRFEIDYKALKFIDYSASR